ncbi:MAG: hypothetical protein IT173_04875 [Acidobacteria bacterium]|nr:hypothetical protein [Acidobacteriota bacterium]
MKKIFLLAVHSLLFTPLLFAQTGTFDIATFVPPAGWQRQEANGSLSFHTSKTVGGLTSLCHISLYPSGPSSGSVSEDFKRAWNNLVTIPARSSVQPVTEPARSDGGWQVMTGTANVTQSGVTYTGMLVTATGFGKTMSFMVKMIGNDQVGAVAKFFDDLKLDARAPSASPGGGGMGAATQAGAASLRDHEFTAPPGWQIRNNADHVRIQSPESGCLILIFAPQGSSGDLEKDARAVFATMYPGWQFQKAGWAQYTLSKGYTPQGLEYFMMEALMGKLAADGSRYDGFEEGAALVIKAGAQSVIISVRHNSSLMEHANCYKKYEYWSRFFNTFAVRNAPIPRSTEQDAVKRIIGGWSMTESGGTGEYIFAANGNYAFVGALGTSYTTKDLNYEYLHTTTYAFQGDGSYSIAGSQLTLKKRGRPAEIARFRFDQVNHGGTGWKDRIYLLRRDSVGESEASYEKSGR